MIENNQQNDLRTLKILHLAFLVGPILFLLISLFVVSTGQTGDGLEMYSYQISIGMIVLSTIVILISRYRFNNSLESLKNNGLSPANNFEKYRGALIGRWATIQFAEILSLILFLLSGNYYLVILVVAMLIYFFTIRPIAENISNDLGISFME